MSTEGGEEPEREVGSHWSSRANRAQRGLEIAGPDERVLFWFLGLFFFLRFYLFIERHRERGRDTVRGRSRLPSGSLMWDLIPGPWDHALSGMQTLNH